MVTPLRLRLALARVLVVVPALALLGAHAGCSSGDGDAAPAEGEFPEGDPTGPGGPGGGGRAPDGAASSGEGGASLGDGGAGDGGDAAPPRYVDPCEGRAATCAVAPAGFAEASGLRVADRCAYPMKPTAGFGANGALLDALEKLAPRASMAEILADTNRLATQTAAVPGGPPGVAYAFRWNQEDDDSEAWIPQGISGSADADPSGLVAGKRVVLVSFYEDAGLEKGVRIAITDVTNPATPRYRFALLVEPRGTPAAPTLAQVDSHAGGIVWFGSKLYVAQTGTGFRVFDMNRILRVATDQDALGCAAGTCRAGLYKYVIPQIGVVADTSTCGHIYSWVSLDRSSSPPTLVSGEYCSTSACAGPLAGKIFRWPLDPATGLLRGGSGTTWPTAVHFMSHKQVQGGAVRGGTVYLSSSAPAAAGGELYRVAVAKSATSAWIDTPEDLMVDEGRGLLWSLSEGHGIRVVFASRLTSLPAP